VSHFRLAKRDSILSNPEGVTIQDLVYFDVADWHNLFPTIEQGHTDNLKFQSSRLRVWVSRMSLADYDGDVKVWERERLTFEAYVSGKWRRIDREGKLLDYEEGELLD